MALSSAVKAKRIAMAQGRLNEHVAKLPKLQDAIVAHKAQTGLLEVELKHIQTSPTREEHAALKPRARRAAAVATGEQPA